MSELALEARRRGVIVRPLASGVAVSPPLTADESHLDLLAEALAEGVGTLEAAAGSAVS